MTDGTVFAVGWDVSTSIVGTSLLCMREGNLPNEALGIFHLDLTGIQGQQAKADAFDHYAHRIAGIVVEARSVEREALILNFIEDKLSGFARGKTSQQTLIKLAGFNAIASYLICRNFGSEVQSVHPSTVSAVMRRLGMPKVAGRDAKKEATVNFMKRRLGDSYEIELNRNGKPKNFVYDEADAYCIALAGLTRPSSKN